MSLTNLTTIPPTLTSIHPPLALHEALSGITGSISLSSWLFLLLPQFLENYRNQSAEAISLPFILIWFLGDVFNIIGAIWANLVSTVIATGAYFCVMDAVLIGQVLYYGIRNRRREGKGLLEAAASAVRESGRGIDDEDAVQEGVGEDEPLLKRTRSVSITIPGSQDHDFIARRRRSTDVSTARRRRSSAAASSTDEHLANILEERDSASGSRIWLKNIISILAVCAVGTVGWMLAYESGAWEPTDEEPSAGLILIQDMNVRGWSGAQVLGYASAALYLGARIPQIIKNYRDKSCEGLSLLFFILSLMGNLFYGAGILFHSLDRAYVIKNVPWLIGSLGTMFEDVIIFTQFHIYRDGQSEDKEGVEGEGEASSAVV